MMVNSTQVLYFNLTAYFDTGPLKYLYFIIILCLYALIIAANVLLIVVICMNRSLHEPMYFFLCRLFVNELLGSTAVFPFLLIQILLDIHTLSTSLCFLQIFCVHIYGNVEFFMLAVMSYDRYLAICFPLQYYRHMTSRKVILLIMSSWLYPFITITTLIFLSSSLRLCGNIIHKVYCNNYAVVKLACSDTTVNNMYSLILSNVLVFSSSLLIVFTYMRILKVCFSGSKQTRYKAVSTCIPHLASLLNLIFGCCFEITSSRFNMNHVPNIVRIILPLYCMICQPLFNPVMYGLKLSKIWIECKSLLIGSVMDREADLKKEKK